MPRFSWSRPTPVLSTRVAHRDAGLTRRVVDDAGVAGEHDRLDSWAWAINMRSAGFRVRVAGKQGALDQHVTGDRQSLDTRCAGGLPSQSVGWLAT